MRHPGQVRGHSNGRAAGSKHWYKPVYSGGQWNQYLRFHSVGTVLQVCCGGSRVGDVRIDHDWNAHTANVLGDALNLPFLDRSFDTVACDPPYELLYPNRVHLQRELVRVARRLVIFKAPWIPRASGWTLRTDCLTLIGTFTCANVAVLSVIERHAATETLI